MEIFWYIANDDQQEGPFPEADLRALIAADRVTANTFVWSEGMANWEYAGDIPGLIAAPPPVDVSSQQLVMDTPPAGLTPFAANFSVFGLFGWALLAGIGLAFVIPGPWIMTALYRWLVSHLRVPQIPSLSFVFTGKVSDIWWVFILSGLCSFASVPGAYTHAKSLWHLLPLLLLPLQAILSWLILRWVIANISSANDQPLAFRFNGRLLGYLGWTLLLYVSFFTIIGWAWVTTAMMRWITRNTETMLGAVVFNASGWQVLWRSMAAALGCMFIIPIPWLVHWYARWYVSQVAINRQTA